MSRVRVCFLGTPAFAVPALQALLEDEHFEVVGVVTQPDRPAGRKLHLTPSPVKNLCVSQGLRVISPESVNQEVILQEIQSWTAEVAVVVAFGQILKSSFLEMFRFGAVNLHASLLPRWRGAAPIQRAIEAGDRETGVCLQKMVRKLDAGAVIGERRVELDEKINALELHDVLAKLGTELLHIELMDFIRGNLAPTEQDESLVTYARKIEKAESLIDWGFSAERIHNRVRAFCFGPGTFSFLKGLRCKIHSTQKTAASTLPFALQPAALGAHEGRLFVGCGQGEEVLEILELQLESKGRQSAASFLGSTFFAEGLSFSQEPQK